MRVEDLRWEGWEIPIDIPENAIYRMSDGHTIPPLDSEPTGYGWVCTAEDKLQHLADIWEIVTSREEYKEKLPLLRAQLDALVDLFKERSVEAYHAGLLMLAQYEVSKGTFAAVMRSKLDSRSETHV